MRARLMADESIGDIPVSIRYSADVWYIGQSYHLEVPLDADAPDPLAALYRDFLVLHDRIYGQCDGAARSDREPAHRASRGRQRPSGRGRVASARCRSTQTAARDPCCR